MLPIYKKEEVKSSTEEGDVFTEKQDHMGFSFLAKKILERQENGRDTIIVVCGDRRMGKSNWALKLVREYIKARKKKDPTFKWTWKGNFALTTGHALKIYDALPFRSFLFVDEAVDVADKGSAVTRYQKQLKKLMAKIGAKQHLTIFIIPEIFWLTTSILNMATFMVVIPYRFRFHWAYAFFYSKIHNPFYKDKFMLGYIEKTFAKQKNLIQKENVFSERVVKRKDGDLLEKYPVGLFSDLKRIPTFVVMQRFGGVDKAFEKKYIEKVKDLQMKNVEEENEFVKRTKYIALQRKYETLMHNLVIKAGMSFKQLERLHIDPEGVLLIGCKSQSLSDYVDKLEVKFSKKGYHEDLEGKIDEEQEKIIEKEEVEEKEKQRVKSYASRGKSPPPKPIMDEPITYQPDEDYEFLKAEDDLEEEVI
jgi:hypothetical protein